MWRRRAPSALLAALALGAAWPARGTAQQAWFVRAEAGHASIHRGQSTGYVLGARIGRSLDAGHLVRADLGASVSPADEGYVTVDIGAEMRLLPTGGVTPVAGIGAGLITEPGYFGAVVRATLALQFRLGSGTLLRTGGQVATHTGADGPTVLYLGLERGLGPRRRQTPDQP